tara:strand:+ start:2857 stop:5841 length:2985 start_codon:yes stop_codon:yes gene_type:complete
MTEQSSKPKLLLVDGHSLAFRSFYAFSKGGEGGLTTKEGFPTSVTYGFLKSLLENCKALSPQGVIIAFDTPEPTFRHKADSNYKANRDIAPPHFFQDLAELQNILEKDLNLSTCSASSTNTLNQECYEADDVLGTLANQASKNGWKVRILTGDRDLFQLVDDSDDIAVLYMGGGPYAKSSSPLFINESGVNEKLGVEPKKVVDLKALTGDSSDNIPGVKGVGPKTAINLIKENETLDGVYSSLDELEIKGEDSKKGCLKGALKLKLKNDKENAYLSKELARIITNVPIKIFPEMNLKGINSKYLKESLIKLELNSLVRQIESFEATFSPGGYNYNNKEIKSNNNPKIYKVNDSSEDINPLINTDIPSIEPQIISNLDDLNNLIKRLLGFDEKDFPVAIDTETTDLNPFKAELVGIGLCWGEGLKDVAYIPLGHNNEDDIFNIETKEQLSLDLVINRLGAWITSEKHPKVLQNAKYDRLILLRHGIEIKGISMDTLLGDYVLDSVAKHGLAEIAKREFGFTPIKFNEIVPKGKNFSSVSISEASKYCGMDVYLTRKVYFILHRNLKNLGIKTLKLLEEIEQPLEKVLAEMENTGIRIDADYLNELSISTKKNLLELEKEIHNLSGHEFNLNSPKQLAEVLFEKLNLNKRKSRKTKTGWSTDAFVLEKLSSDHPAISKLIEHRTLSKLLSTYIDALPQLIEPETNRLHTDFNQAITSTGRLSSSNPNLQNIPIRTEFSRKIRKAFLPKENWKLLSADYSQIELRILAHLSEEKILIDAYKQGNDVHTLTAKLLLEKDTINSDERRLGKTINFGVIYGMGAQRFARATGVTQDEAKDFLKRFKERYPKVFNFLEHQEKLALSKGYVSTILGRRRYFHFDKNGLGRLLGKDLKEIDLNVARRAGIEAQQLRAAANAPIQGSSADIIKIAMVKMNKQLKENSLPANLLLQVHDELVLEVDSNAIKEVSKIVKETMENALKLNVPLLVEIGTGDNWMDCK